MTKKEKTEFEWYKNAYNELINDQHRLFEALFPGEYLLGSPDYVQVNHALTDRLIKDYGKKKCV